MNMNAQQDPVSRSIAHVVVPYAIFAGLWIFLSDQKLARMNVASDAFAWLSIFKGWAFVLATSALLALLMGREVKKRLRLHEALQRHAEDLEARIEARTRELAATTSFLDALVDHISSPVFYKDANVRFRGCNKAYEKAFSVSRKDIIGKTVLDLEYLPRADREIYQAEDTEMVATAGTLNREATMPFADEREHKTLYSVSGFRAPDGSPGGLVGIIVDITP